MSSQSMKTTLAAAAAAFALAAAPAAGLAAGATAMRVAQSQSQPAQAKPVTEPEMQKFASAAQDVTDIVNQWRPKIDAAAKTGDNDKVQQLRQSLNVKLVQAVKGNGLSVERYNEISNAARTDPDLANKLKEHMKSQNMK